jgi:hypothetical protein
LTFVDAKSRLVIAKQLQDLCAELRREVERAD